MIVAGIDVGTRKVGIALSDSGGMIAFPHEVVSFEGVVDYIAALAKEKNVSIFVVGDGKGYGEGTNAIETTITNLVREIEARGCTVILQAEAGTSGAARAGMGEGAPRGVVQNPTADTRVVDAQAAALILQRYLDSHPCA